MTGDIDKVRAVYEEALQSCSQDWQVYVAAAKFEINSESVTRARTLLNKARIKLPDSAEVWLESIRLEQTSNNEKIG